MSYKKRLFDLSAPLSCNVYESWDRWVNGRWILLSDELLDELLSCGQHLQFSFEIFARVPTYSRHLLVEGINGSSGPVSHELDKPRKEFLPIDCTAEDRGAGVQHVRHGQILAVLVQVEVSQVAERLDQKVHDLRRDHKGFVVDRRAHRALPERGVVERRLDEFLAPSRSLKPGKLCLGSATG